MRLKLNSNLIKSAKAMVGLIEKEKLAIDLTNKLNGYEKELDIEEQFNYKYINMLYSIIAHYNLVHNGRLNVILYTRNTPNTFRQMHTQYLKLVNGDEELFLLQQGSESIPYKSFLIEELAYKALRDIAINGLYYYINKQS